MSMYDFMHGPAKDEVSALEFLRVKGILETIEEARCQRISNGTKCGYELYQATRSISGGIRKRIYWRCKKQSCNSSRSIRAKNAFFFYSTDSRENRSKISLNKVLELVFLFLYTNITVERACFLGGVSKPTVIDWWYSCRTTVTKSLESDAKFVGTRECPVQIDEVKICGTAKYRKGRRLDGDARELDDELKI